MIINLDQAIERLLKGEVVAVPTETVYGLAACINHPNAIKKIFTLKGRPLNNPLIVHLSKTSEAIALASSLPPAFEDLANAFWPGAMTCILSIQKELIPTIVRGNLPTAAFRVPALPLTRSLIEAVGPIVMPSANLSGRPSATCQAHVQHDFGSDFPILGGEACQMGVESTILIYSEHKWSIARLGALPPETFQPILGYQPEILEAKGTVDPLCPGQFFRHYAPQAQLLLENQDREKGEVILGFHERIYPIEKPVIILGSLNHPEEVAENLYSCLRKLDEEGYRFAWIDMNFSKAGLWRTIEERLRRASEK